MCSENNLGQPEHNYEKYYTLKEGDVFFEGGAFWGRYILIASKKVGEKGQVIAVEPSPDNILTIEAVIQNRNLTIAILIKKALWNSKDKTLFCIDGNPSGHRLGPGTHVIDVETDTIDNILEELGIVSVNLLAMDIEGAEVEALKGTTKSLENKKILNLAVAAYHLPEHPDQIMSFLTSKGYRDVKHKDDVVYAHV